MAILKPGQLSTGSYNISGSFSGSFSGDGSNLINIPTQSFETGSFATTGSNVFKGLQTIHGNLFMSGSFPLIYNNDATNNMLFGMFDGSTIYGPYYQLFGNQYPNLLQRGDAEFVYDIRNNPDANFHIASFNGSSWTQKFLVNDIGAQITGSLDVTGGITGSLLGTASYIENAQTASYVLQAVSASYASVANSVNDLNQNIFISGALTVLGGATFYGSSSFVYVTASQLAVSASFISVNVFEPIERFGGLKVYDSGSSTATASLAWDSLHNHWVYQNVSGATYTGGMLLAGPRNTGSLGDEPTLTQWYIPRGDGGDHLNDSQIYSSGSTHIVTGSLTVTQGVTGSLLGTASYATQALSASFAPSTPAFPFTGSALITGSLGVTGSLSTQAQGALSTDIAFRVRNSVDTQNSFQIDGLGQGRIKSTGFTPRFSVGYDWFGTDRNAFVFTQNIQNFRGQEWTFDAGYNGSFEGLQISNDLAGNDKGQFTIQLNNYCFGTSMLNNDTGTNERRVIRLASGVAPTTSKTDEIKFYSSDITAGNAAPHFRTENGSIIKLYQQSAVTSSQGIADALTNLGFLTGSSVITSTAAFPYTGSALITGSLGVTGSVSFMTTGSGVTSPFTFTAGGTATSPYVKVITSDGVSEASLTATRLAGTSVTSNAINRGFLYLGNAAGYTNVIGSNEGIAFSAATPAGYDPANDQMRLKSGNLYIGTNYTGTARLDVKAQGALSTDIAFRVRNSADTFNLFSIQGDGGIYSRMNTATQWWQTNSSDGVHRWELGFTGNLPFIAIGGQDNTPRMAHKAVTDNREYAFGLVGPRANMALGQTFAQGTVKPNEANSNTFYIFNGTAPTLSATDSFNLYSADRGGTAGRASAHFRSEDGTINVIGDLSGFGTSSPGARLDVRAQGALSTDIAFRVRNSADTADLLNIQGNNIGNFSKVYFDLNSGVPQLFNIDTSAAAGASFLLGTSTISLRDANANFVRFIGGGVRSIAVNNGAANTGLADAFEMYSADRGGVNGRASAHFRSEDGTINVLGDLSGIGTATPQARLDVRAQGALSTDIAFRVRNSADNDNIAELTGNGLFRFGLTSGYHISLNPTSPSLRGQNGATVVWQLSPWTGEHSWLTNNATNQNLIGIGITSPTDKLHINNTINDYRIRISVGAANPADESCGIRFTTTWAGTSFGADAANLVVRTKGTNNISTQRTALEFRMNALGTSALRASLTGQSNFLLQSPTEDTNDVGVIYIPNGTAPTSSIVDGYKQYSADIVAGNAAPHFRTENGSIIKLYKEIQPALSGSANTGDPATDALIEAMKTIILNLGFGASS